MAAPKPRIKAKPEVMEIASIQRDINRWTYGGVLENLDETLRTRGRGKGLAIYDELERDAHCYAELQKRKLAVAARPWQVDSASDAAIDKDAADLVKRQFGDIGKAIEDESQLITGFDQTTINFLDATLKGYAVGEVMWEIRGAEVWASRVLPRDQRRFVFDERSRLRLLTRENLMLGEELPPRKFVVHRFGAKDGSPYGKGLGHILFWPVFFKRQDLSFWLVFADKFGSPTAIGKYPAGAKKDEQDKLLATLTAIAQDAGIIIPEGMIIEFLEASRTGSIDTYERLARYMDEQISKTVLGGTITSTAQSTGLGSGVADAQNDVRIEIARADADLLSDTLNATLVRWIVDYNLPGAGYPRIWRDFEEREDIERRARVDTALHTMGYEPESVEYINETYGGRWRKKTATPPDAWDAPSGAERAEFAQEQPRAPKGSADGGQWTSTGGSRAVPGSASRSQRARASHKPATLENQRRAAKFEASVSQAVRGKNLDDNEPFDVVKGRHAVEVKAIIGGKNPKITMHPDSLARKTAYLKKHKMIGHTVAIDARGDVPKYYYKSGVGSFRLSSMERVTRAQLTEKIG